MTDNTFTHPISQVRFGQYRPKDVESALDAAEKLAWERVNAALVVEKTERNFTNTVLAVTRATEEFEAATGIVSHLHSVLDEPWTEANKLATERSSKLSNELSFHAGIYKAYLEVRDRNGAELALTAQEAKLLDELIIAFERNGIALPEPDQLRLKEIRSELSNLSVQFSQNAVKASDEAGFLVTDPKELAGLSDDFIDKAHHAASEQGKTGYWVEYSQPTYAYVMSTCAVRATRQTYYEVHLQRAAATNEPIARQILKLRQEKVKLLHYKDYADYALERRMAKTGTAAYEFICDLKGKYRPKMLAEFAELQEFARKLEQDENLELDASDVDTGIGFYYSSKQLSESVGIDEDELKSYFNLNKVLEVMFETLQTLYGVTFAKSTQPTWHEDVQVYDIREGNKTLATVWCDWYARKGKRGGAWANVFYDADRSGESDFLPHLGLVVANLEAPDSQGRCRMTMRDVETVWHEFGHFMHVAVSATQLKEQSAFSCKWDFVEAPSQIMENWVWQTEILHKLARHETSGKPLSDEILQKLLAGRVFHIGLKAMRQILLASVDLRLHREYDPNAEVGVVEYSRAQKEEFLPVPVHSQDANIATFSHIFAGGYAAGYYSYKWAESIEADLFTRFAVEGVTNPTTGRSYRQEILSKGSELEPEELIANFLGRAATPDAMLIRDGIKTA